MTITHLQSMLEFLCNQNYKQKRFELQNFKASGVYTKQAHVKIPKGKYEEEHGRKGFFGRVSHLYHDHPLTGWTHIEGSLKPQLLAPSFQKKEGYDPYEKLLYNQDLNIYTGLIQRNFQYFFRNADSDEIFFIHSGQGHIETVYGSLPLNMGDYLVLPKGTTYKIFVKSPLKVLKIESASEIEEPSRGLLGPNALFDQTAKIIPEASVGSEQDLDEYKVEIKHGEEKTIVTYPFNPLDASGWKGSVYPWKISIYDFCPVTSHKYHLPPSAHTTFVCYNFVVCSFVARPLEHTKEGVLKVPFFHSNIDYDEVLFYHQGDFFSRDNIESGALTFHPRGIHHGPHPKAFESANDKEFTDEYAVMIDTSNKLYTTKFFEQNKDKNYWKSWKTK